VPTITLTSDNPARAEADAVVVGIIRTKRGIALAPGAKPVDGAYTGRLVKDLQSLGATGKAGEITRLPARGRMGAALVTAVGLGSDPGPEELRRGAGAAARACAGSGTVVLALPATTVAEVAAVAEGALFGAYSFDTYRTAPAGRDGQPDKRRPVKAFRLATPLAASREAKAALTHAKVVGRSVHLTRDLVNTSPSDLSPADFAATAVKSATGLKLEVQVWDDAQLRKGGFGGLTAVGQGSVRGPRLVRVAYRHPAARRHVAIVGKGITFDSGGLSLKPPAGMEWMKTDMSSPSRA
jgi:leucyl aminopeptidase